MLSLVVVLAIIGCVLGSDIYPDSEIDTTVYISNEAVGGNGGTHFRLENRNALLRSLTVYRNREDIKGLMIELNNGTSMPAGTLTDTEQPVKLEFSDDEQITRIIIYYDESANYPTKIVKGIHLNTNKGVKEAFIHGGSSGSDFQSHELPVGSGYCSGVFGTAMGALDRVGLAMLRVSPSKRCGGGHRVD